MAKDHRKITKKDLKKDKFVEEGMMFAKWMYKHKNAAQYIIIGAVIVVAVGVYFYWTGQTKNNRAKEAYTTALIEYNKGNIEGALTNFEDISKLYGKTQYGINAGYWLANIYYLEGKYKESQEAYETYIKKGKDELLIQSSQLGIADSYLQTGDNLKAAQKYEEFNSKYPKSLLTPKAISNAIKCYKLLGNTERINTLTTTLNKNFPNSQYTL
ncbi:MAG: tetratricopeptide repeat protein [bacterium]